MLIIIIISDLNFNEFQYFHVSDEVSEKLSRIIMKTKMSCRKIQLNSLIILLALKALDVLLNRLVKYDYKIMWL